MKILMNTKEGNLKRFSKITGIQFERLDAGETNDAVAVVLQDDNFQFNLDKALGLDIPIVAIAGYENSENHQYAIEAGVPDEAILIIRDDVLTNQGEFQLHTKKGLKLNDLMKLCKYVHKKNILPEIYVWLIPEPDPEDKEIWSYKDSVAEVEPVEVKPVAKPAINPADIDPEFRITNRQQPVQANKDGNPKGKQINQMPIEDFTKQYKKVIAIFKTDPKINGGAIIKKIAVGLNAFHLEMTENPSSYRCYAEPINKAVQASNYGYLTDQEIAYNVSSNTLDTLVIEVDTSQNILALTESIMPYITHIIHLTGSYDKNKKDIDDWLSMELPIHGILPTMDEDRYRKQYAGLVKTIKDIQDM